MKFLKICQANDLQLDSIQKYLAEIYAEASLAAANKTAQPLPVIEAPFPEGK